jgi:hypothetical protein
MLNKKTAANHIKTFKYILQLFSTAEENINNPLLFDTVSRTFNPVKILSEKTCWLKLRSIAELSAFDCIIVTVCLYLIKINSGFHK